MKAFELCGEYDDQSFKLKGGRVIWQCITYMDRADKCLCTRFTEEPPKRGGISFLGLYVRKMYINPDTEIEIVEE